jgi:hypothetical protein
MRQIFTCMDFTFNSNTKHAVVLWLSCYATSWKVADALVHIANKEGLRKKLLFVVAVTSVFSVGFSKLMCVYVTHGLRRMRLADLRPCMQSSFSHTFWLLRLFGSTSLRPHQPKNEQVEFMSRERNKIPWYLLICSSAGFRGNDIHVCIAVMVTSAPNSSSYFLPYRSYRAVHR